MGCDMSNFFHSQFKDEKTYHNHSLGKQNILQVFHDFIEKKIPFFPLIFIDKGIIMFHDFN